MLGGALAFDKPIKPPPLASIFNPFADVDFGDLPPVQTYIAHDGTKLGFRTYQGGETQAIVLIHGSSDDGTGLHPLAKALRDAGATIFVPVIRGHGNSGQSGDINYIGELEDDLADLATVLRSRRPNASYTLIGFSAGGGFVLRVIGSPIGNMFERFIMISPALPQDAPTNRPANGGWISLAWPRIVALAILNAIGVDWFNGLPIVAFATSPVAPNLTAFYSYRLAINFGAPANYLSVLRHSPNSTALLMGGADELFFSDRFASLIATARPDLKVTIVPGVNHVGMTASPDGISAVSKKFLEMTMGGDRRPR